MPPTPIHLRFAPDAVDSLDDAELLYRKIELLASLCSELPDLRLFQNRPLAVSARAIKIMALFFSCFSGEKGGVEQLTDNQWEEGTPAWQSTGH